MAGYQTIEALRPILHQGPPATPIVDRLLVGRPEQAPIIRKLGRPSNAPLLPEVVEVIVALRQTGMSQRRIAAQVGVTPTCVRKYSRHIPPPPGGWNKARPPSIQRNKPFAERLKRAGFTYAEIAEELGCCESQAYYLLNKRRFVGVKASPMSRLVQSVARATGLACQQLRQDRDVRGGRSDPDVSRARAILFWLARSRLEKNSLQAIGRSLGGFDHTSVRHGFHRTERVATAHCIEDVGPAVRVARALWQAEWPKATT